MLSFANSTGALFNRLGSLGNLIKAAKTYQTAQQPNLIDTTLGAVAQFNGESDIQALIGSTYISLLNSVDNVGSFCQNVAQTTINRMIFRDNPQISQNLQSLNVNTSILEVIRQMKVAGASVLAMTITATPTIVNNPGPHFTGTGNGVINSSTLRPLDGKTLENAFGETLTFVCSSDSYLGGATAGNEGFQITGTGSESDFFAFDWPLGSNASASCNAIDGNVSNGSGNLLTNSGFNSFVNVANVPDNWTLAAGTAGTNVFQENTLVYDGASALRLLGDGATKITLQQPFNSATGTAGALSPLTQYSFNLFMRRDAIAPGAGVLTVSLIDQNGNPILDMAGNANSTSFTLTGSALTTNYAPFSGAFRTPIILPAQAFIELQLTTALTTGRSVYLDKLSLGGAQQLQASEIFVAVHAGSVPFVQGDYAYLVKTNGRGAGGTISTWQTLMAQLFPQFITNEYLLPSAASPTISDNLI